MGKYIMNQETQKLELHFQKQEYMALPESTKAEIKSTFLWSGKAGAWVSRSIHNHYRAEQIAIKLGLENGGKTGERLSYAEELERKAERAEARAERYEQYSENAEKRAVTLQADFNKYRKDWSWLTQPIIAGHAGSRAFANHRNKVMARYDRGFEEYKKSEYYQGRAATARATANNAQLENPVYLHNRIKECNKNLKIYQKYIGQYEGLLYKIQQGVPITHWSGAPMTEEYIEEQIAEQLDKYDYEYGKLEFFEKCLADLGGNQFSKENIKVGYIVKMQRSGKCEIVTAGPVNVTYKILEGGAAGMFLTAPYAAIEAIISDTPKDKEKIENPYKIGDILCKHYGMSTDNAVYAAWEIIKITESGLKIQQIKVADGIPQAGAFIGKPIQKKLTKSKFSDFTGIYVNDWMLHKYTPKNKTS